MVCGNKLKAGEAEYGINIAAQGCPLCVECWFQPFAITSVCRADLQEYLAAEEIARFDDADMEYLARKMADAYTEQVFWIDLEIIAQAIAEAKA